MFDNYYGQQIYQVLSEILNLLQGMNSTISYILYTVIFAFFAFIVFNFIHKRWFDL